mmetsp:Transcript_13267/g.23759  ORF Transcript_13267/g.23759 Transcript_13267/m.23759 type:complete len:81 (-) Transcript_13267:142-384(-)
MACTKTKNLSPLTMTVFLKDSPVIMFLYLSNLVFIIQQQQQLWYIEITQRISTLARTILPGCAIFEDDQIPLSTSCLCSY